MPTYTLFGQPAAPATLAVDNNTYTLGIQFTVSQPGTLTAIWFFSASGAVDLPSQIALFSVSGRSLVTSQAASWSGAAGSGWVRAAFTSPPQLTGGASYKACILHGPGGNFYASTAHYWDSGSGSAGISSGPLSAPNNAGGDGGQDTFNAGAALTYPLSVGSASNYWIDPEITTTGGGVLGFDAATSLILGDDW